MVKSFLYEYSNSFENSILFIIGEYAGSRSLFAHTRLCFCVRKDRHLGKIQVWKTCEISGASFMVKLLRTEDWAIIHDPSQYAWFFEFWNILSRVRREIETVNPHEFDKLDHTLLNLFHQLRPAVLNYTLVL